jgi:hypothetical protein
MERMTRRSNLARLDVARFPLRSPEVLPPAVLPAEEWWDYPFTLIGIALDRIALRGMRLALDAALHFDEADRDALAASAAPYTTAELAANPRRFFGFLDGAPPAITMRELRRRALPDGEVVTREFLTHYEPYHRSDTWPTCEENDRVVVEHWMHRPGPPRATMLALHGFTMGTAWIDAHVLMAATWFSFGFDVALVTLPFHGERCPRTSRYSGELFGSWDVGRTNEAVRQAVHDVDLVKRWIAATTGRPVGLLGLSLGGYVAALMAGLCDDLAFVIPLLPPATLDALASSLLALDRPRAAVAPPIALADLRAAYAVHSPLTYPSVVPSESLLIVGARGDCLVPPEHAHALWRHWGEPAIHWYSGSHMAPFRRARLVSRVQQHLDALDLGWTGLVPCRQMFVRR